MELTNQVFETIKRNKLLKPKDSVLVALSGGPDSVAMLHSLVRLKSNLKLNISALYINHQIRPQAAKKEVLFCRNLCRKLKVKFVTITEDIPRLSKRLGQGIEQTARDFRYEKFEETAKKVNCNKIALGHHRDDQVETILFRLFRGTGPTGLLGIPIKRGKIIRPLFDLTKSEILSYLKKNKLKYCLDISNQKSDFTRNFIRNKLLPLIRNKINSNADSSILNLVDTIKEDENFLESVTDAAFTDCVTHTAGGKLVVALDCFSGYHLSIQRRLLRRCIAKVSGVLNPPDKETISNLLAVVKGSAKAVSIPSGIQCRRKGNELFFVKKSKPPQSKKILRMGQTRFGELGAFKLIKSATANIKEINRARKSNKVIVDFDRLSLPLLARNIQNGDRFRPLGMSGSKKIGDYLTDRKVKTEIRDEIPVVADQKGIIWLVGFEIDERVKIDRSTKKALKIEFLPAV